MGDAHIDFADEWIISRFNETLVEFNNAMDNFEINNATKIVYSLCGMTSATGMSK
ncbi:MAG: class I tRNA ligase family protein [Ignavibacteriaceae bacterium]|nr:class I tRNA ligase family protein [Ignavibacteriaceae bacterium]